MNREQARQALYLPIVDEELRATSSPDTLEERLNAYIWRVGDRPLAPTSETALWGRWCARRDDGLPQEEAELLDEAAWWITAYDSLAELEGAIAVTSDEDIVAFWDAMDRGDERPGVLDRLMPGGR